jgi:two-component system cell cycle response regulator DivK
MPKEMKRILVVDESEDGRRLVRFALRGINAEIVEARSVEEASEILQTQYVSLVVTELPLDRDLWSGLEVIRMARLFAPSTTVLVYTAHVMQDAEDKARGAGADEFLSKPQPHLSAIRETVSRLLEEPASHLH